MAPLLIVITPRGAAGLARWRELWAARDLWWFLICRDLKTRYVQSILGLGWAVIQPLTMMFAFTLVFGRLFRVSTGNSPYALYSLMAVVAWTFFQSSASEAGNSLINNLAMVSKVYFPRLILPLAAVGAKVFDLAIMLGLLGVTMVIYHTTPLPIAVVAVPAAFGVAFLAALALGLWLAGMSVQYRDVRHAQAFGLQLLMWASPVVYPLDKVPARWLPLYSLNPMAGVIETLNAALLGNGPVPWYLLALGVVVSLVGLAGGVWCFHRSERIVVDVG